MPRPNKGPQLSDEPNSAGFYEIRWTEGGRSKRRSTGCTDYCEAQTVFAHFILGAGSTGAPAARNDGWTVREACDYYLTEKVADLLESDREVITGRIMHVCAVLGDEPVAALSDEHVRRYLRERAKGAVTYTDAKGQQRGGRKASPGTCRGELAMLVAALNFCILNRKIKRADMPELSLPAPPDPRERYLTKEEAGRCFAACAPLPGQRLSRSYRLLALGLSTAARGDAIAKLKWDRVDFVSGLIDFNEPGRRKTKKRRSVVPMSTDLRAVLERAYTERVSEYVLDTPSKQSNRFARILAKAKVNVPEGSGGTHLMRHTWATWQAQAGQSITHIASILGDTVATTEKHYAKMRPQTLQHVVDASALPGLDRAEWSGVITFPGAKNVQQCSTLSQPDQGSKPMMTG